MAAVESSYDRAPGLFGWGGSSLYAGWAGSAMALRRAASIDQEQAERWTSLAHAAVVRAVESTHTYPVEDASMGAGTAGLVVMLADAAERDPRYEPALRAVGAQLVAQAADVSVPRTRGALDDAAYDVVSGASGTLLGLLTLLQTCPDLALEAPMARLVDDLQWLSGLEPDGSRRSVLSPASYVTEDTRADFPHGHTNLGYAHGLPGVLSALSLLHTAGWRSSDLRPTISRLSSYLMAVTTPDSFGPSWPTGIAVDTHGRDLPPAESPARTAWCYGAPGIALSLLQAGEALDEPALRTTAVAALAASLRRVQDRPLLSATFCHGSAGLLALAGTFRGHLGRSAYDSTVATLCHDVLAGCSEDHALVVQDVQDHATALDNPGLLSGSAGVALTLWDTVAGTGGRWQRTVGIG